MNDREKELHDWVHADTNQLHEKLDTIATNDEIVICAWWALCGNPATGTRPHPILGHVPICDRCNQKVEDIG